MVWCGVCVCVCVCARVCVCVHACARVCACGVVCASVRTLQESTDSSLLAQNNLKCGVTRAGRTTGDSPYKF